MNDGAKPAPAVVGASGFIGTALTTKLGAAGLRVRTFTRDVPFLAGPERLASGVKRSGTVFWLSTSVNPAIAHERPDLVEYDQAQFEALLRGLEDARHTPRVVLLSSGGTVYDPTSSPPYREGSPVRGVSAYARAKLRLEETLHTANIPDACKLVVRAANAYGPGQPARRGQGVIAYWLRAARSGERLILLGDRSTVRDYVYIDDLTDALVKLHQLPGPLPRILNIGSGRRISLGELAQTVLDVVGNESLSFDFRPARSFDVPSTWLDIELATSALGWTPRVSLHEGIAAAWRSVGDEPAPATPRSDRRLGGVEQRAM